MLGSSASAAAAPAAPGSVEAPGIDWLVTEASSPENPARAAMHFPLGASQSAGDWHVLELALAVQAVPSPESHAESVTLTCQLDGQAFLDIVVKRIAGNKTQVSTRTLADDLVRTTSGGREATVHTASEYLPVQGVRAGRSQLECAPVSASHGWRLRLVPERSRLIATSEDWQEVSLESPTSVLADSGQESEIVVFGTWRRSRPDKPATLLATYPADAASAPDGSSQLAVPIESLAQLEEGVAVPIKVLQRPSGESLPLTIEVVDGYNRATLMVGVVPREPSSNMFRGAFVGASTATALFAYTTMRRRRPC